MIAHLTRNRIDQCKSRVLIVDRSADNREVLRTALERQGYQIFEAGGSVSGLQIAQQCHPQVFVLDLDTVDPADTSVCEDFDSQARMGNASMVLLGRISAANSHLPTSDVVAKPYHYAPLIRKIEELLREADGST